MATVTPSIRTATIDFAYGNSETFSRRLEQYERHDFVSASGFGILVDGITPNTKLTGDVACDLVLRPLYQEVHPATTMASNTGKIFGTGYKWRIRFRNSGTGECTGLTPLYTTGYNLGVSGGGSGSWQGATAYFYLTGTATTNGLDTIDLFRNTSSQDREFYLVTSVANPGASSYVYITDNEPDEDLFNKELASVSVNPSYRDGIPTSYARLYQHGTGRLWLYGIRRQGKIYGARAIMLVGSELITNDVADPPWHRGMEGMMFRWTSADALKANYRIVEVLTSLTMRVNRQADVSNIPVGSTNIDGVYEIVDDRDARNIQMSQPQSAVQYDPEDVLTIGKDISDPLHAVFALGTKTYCLTRRRLIELDGDLSTDPVTTTRQNVVSEVGCVGLWAWAVTPFGVVYVNDKHGVMVYDGTGLPLPLGGVSPLDDFKPKTQFESIDRSHLEDTYVEWDAINKRLIVSYTRDGREAEDECIVFADGIWRGPWRQRIYRMGRLYNNNGEDAWVFGDDLGQLHVPDAQVYDIIADTEERVVSAYSAVSNKVTYTGTEMAATGVVWGVPVLFHNGSGAYYLNWIGYLTTTKIMHLLLVPEVDPVAGWTFRVGQIHWTGKTAMLDFGEPGQPKKLDRLSLRWERVEGGADNLVISAATEGATITAAADSATTATTAGLSKGTARPQVGGSGVTIQFHGRARYGGPKITNILAHMNVGQGEDDFLAAVQSKVILTPTVSP